MMKQTIGINFKTSLWRSAQLCEKRVHNKPRNNLAFGSVAAYLGGTKLEVENPLKDQSFQQKSIRLV